MTELPLVLNFKKVTGIIRCPYSVWRSRYEGDLADRLHIPCSYQTNKVASYVFCVFESSPASPVAFHHDQDNLMQDSETAVNLQVIKPQWFTVGTAAYTVRLLYGCVMNDNMIKALSGPICYN